MFEFIHELDGRLEQAIMFIRNFIYSKSLMNNFLVLCYAREFYLKH